MAEPIAEWLEMNALCRNVSRIGSADWVDSSAISSALEAAHLGIDTCYEACIQIIDDDREVVELPSGAPLSLEEIEKLLEDRRRWLDGYERIAQNLSFAHWAGGSLSDHDNEAHVTQVFDEKLNFLYDRHAVRDHVAIEYHDLQATMDHKQLRVNSTFHNYKIAEQAVSRIMAFYWDHISAWLALTEEQERDWWKRNVLSLPLKPSGFETSKDLGYAAKKHRSKRHITTKLRVVLVRDSHAPKGFWIKDAYPTL